MRRMWLMGWLVLLAVPAEAAIVCQVKSTGQVLETQGAAKSGICLKNWVTDNPQYGFTPDQIEELVVTEAERQQHLDAWRDDDDNPDKAKRAQEQQQEQEIPLGNFGAGAAGALAILAGQGFVVRVRKKKEPPV